MSESDKASPETKAKSGATSRPSSIEEYELWAEANLAVVYDEPTRNLSETNVKTILNAAQKSRFFDVFVDSLEECAKKYERTIGGSRMLTRDPSSFGLLTKSFKSMVDKSFRQNVIWNKRWPSKPMVRIGDQQVGEWVTPLNWHEMFNDLVRGTLVLRYIDGPGFLADWLLKEAGKHGLKARVEPRALDDGYYAYHLYVELSVELLRQDWTKFHGKVWVEIQLTTQLQEVARDLSHSFYEQRRIESRRDRDWKWDYSSNRFKAAYISHSLHLIEGLIVELRDGIAKTRTSVVEELEASTPLTEKADGDVKL